MSVNEVNKGLNSNSFGRGRGNKSSVSRSGPPDIFLGKEGKVHMGLSRRGKGVVLGNRRRIKKAREPNRVLGSGLGGMSTALIFEAGEILMANEVVVKNIL